MWNVHAILNTLFPNVSQFLKQLNKRHLYAIIQELNNHSTDFNKIWYQSFTLVSAVYSMLLIRQHQTLELTKWKSRLKILGAIRKRKCHNYFDVRTYISRRFIAGIVISNTVQWLYEYVADFSLFMLYARNYNKRYTDIHRCTLLYIVVTPHYRLQTDLFKTVPQNKAF